MTDDDETATAIRLNILGSLEIEREGEPLPLPETAAAHHLLALFAVKDKYRDQQLVDTLWPGDSLSDDRLGNPESVRGRLNRAVSDARAALGVRASSGVLKRQNNVVHRVRGNQVIITTDHDDFHRLRPSEQADDWRAALALVRGPVAQDVPTRNRQADWINDQQARQRNYIATLLKNLYPDADEETIKHRVQEVLDDQGSSQPGIEPQATPERDTTTPFLSPPRRDSLSSSGRQWLTKRNVAPGVVATFLALAASIVLFVRSGGVSIPAEGSVVDAETGAIVAHPRIATSHMPAQLEFGPTMFRACDLSAGSSCGSGPYGPVPLKVHVGDIIAFRVTLNNGSNTPIHYLKLESLAQSRVLEADPPTRSRQYGVSQTELEVRMSVKWPETRGAYETVNEPGLIRGHNYGEMPPIKPLYLQLPRSGRYGLVYISGSTTLVNKKVHFFHHLPDGIMRYGIYLENVGPPPSCFWCAEQYIRYAYFHAQVTGVSN